MSNASLSQDSSSEFSLERTAFNIYRGGMLLGDAPSVEIDLVPQDELAHVLERCEVHGSAFRGAKLMISDLTRLGMEPNYKLTIDDRALYLAGQLYLSAPRRVAIIAYVQDGRGEDGGEKFTVRSYYRSNSQGGSWRYLPGVAEDEGRIFWYSKGFDENSLSLRRELLEVIQYIRVRGGIRDDLNAQDRDRLFAGTTWKPRFGGGRERVGDGENTYINVTDVRGHTLNTDTWTSDPSLKRRTPAHLVKVSRPEEQPDIEHCLQTFPIESPLNSDGVPDQLIIRRGKFDTEPIVLHLVPDVRDDRLSVTLPNGAVLNFEGPDNNHRLVEICSVDGHREKVSFSASTSVERDDGDLARLSSVGSNEEKFYFTHTGRLIRAEFSPSNEIYEFVYGVMTVRCFESKERLSDLGAKMEYLYHTDKFARSMFGSIAVRGPINELGLCSHWPRSPSLMTPLYEYGDFARNDGDWSDVVDSYVCMWPRYISQIPLIRQIHQRYIDAPLPAILEPSTIDFSPLENVDSDLIEFQIGVPVELGEIDIPDDLGVNEYLPDPPQALERLATDRAEFRLGAVPFTAALDPQGNLRLTIRTDADSVIFQRSYLRRVLDLTLGKNGSGKAIDDPSIAFFHASLSYVEARENDILMIKIYLTRIAQAPASIEGDDLKTGERALLVQRAAPVR